MESNIVRCGHYGNLVKWDEVVQKVMLLGHYGTIVYNIRGTNQFVVVSVTPCEVDVSDDIINDNIAKEHS